MEKRYAIKMSRTITREFVVSAPNTMVALKQIEEYGVLEFFNDMTASDISDTTKILSVKKRVD